MDPISLFIIIVFILITIGGLLYSQYALSKSKQTWVPHVNTKISQIYKLIDSPNSEQKKYALIEMDKLLDYTLIKTGAKGDSMGNRLKYAKKWFEKNHYNKIWESHKARNILVHEVQTSITDQRIVEHIKTLEKAIKVLIR